MFISGIFSFIGETAEEIIVGIFLLIDSLVYSLISWLYQIFCVLASFCLFVIICMKVLLKVYM